MRVEKTISIIELTFNVLAFFILFGSTFSTPYLCIITNRRIFCADGLHKKKKMANKQNSTKQEREKLRVMKKLASLIKWSQRLQVEYAEYRASVSINNPINTNKL